MSNKNGTSTLSIIGLVLAILAIVLSFIPCVGVVAFIPGIIALIIGGISLAQAKDSGSSNRLPIIILVVSFIAILASANEIYKLYSLSKKASSEVKVYDNCEDLEKEFKAIVQNLEDLDGSDDISDIGEVMSATFKLTQLGKQADELGCDIDTSIDTSDNESEDKIKILKDSIE